MHYRFPSAACHVRQTFLTALIAVSSAVGVVQAHEVWIEDLPTGQLVVRFAEFGDSFEKSPGALDSLALPGAWATVATGQATSFEVQKKADHFLLAGALPAQAVQAETGFAVMGKPGNPEKPASKPFFYARWQPAGAGAAEPSLNLDIVPTGTAGEARVYFRGKPLPTIKLKLHTPDGAEQELTADTEGRVRFDASKPGFYLLSAARHREPVPGFAGGKPYDVTSHNCSLAWRVADASAEKK